MPRTSPADQIGRRLAADMPQCRTPIFNAQGVTLAILAFVEQQSAAVTSIRDHGSSAIENGSRYLVPREWWSGGDWKAWLSASRSGITRAWAVSIPNLRGRGRPALSCSLLLYKRQWRLTGEAFQVGISPKAAASGKNA
jgi:hypothetical protein